VRTAKKEGEIMIVRRAFGRPRWDWGGFNELDSIRTQMNRLFGDLAGRYTSEPKAGVFPLTNVSESKDNYYVRAELPGVKGEDLDITITGDSLAIAGERKIATEKEGARYHRREREAGKFSRMITLPGQVDPDKVKATCADGVLTIVFPKAASARPRQIAVKPEA
jgi:HSP20 family protein